jgi:hypothetical protein
MSRRSRQGASRRLRSIAATRCRSANPLFSLESDAEQAAVDQATAELAQG